MRQFHVNKITLVFTFIIAILSSPGKLFAQAGDLDLSFNRSDPGFGNPAGGANNILKALAYQADGKILIGGSFTSYNGQAINYFARLNQDGSIDPTFNTGGAGPNAAVKKITVLAAGKMLVGGTFTSYNGTTVSNIIRLNSNGSLDGTFTSTITNGVNEIFVQPDSKILVGCNSGPALVRLDANGTKEVAFHPAITSSNPRLPAFVQGIAVQADGKIIAGGGFFSPASETGGYNIARFNSDGTYDTTWHTGVSLYVYAVLIQPDGKILVGGSFTNRIIRLNTDGTLDPSFNPSALGATAAGYLVNALGSPTVSTIALQADGKLIIGGDFKNYNGTITKGLARLNADGSLDHNFNVNNNITNDTATIYQVAISPDSKKIVIAGYFKSFGNIGRNNIARLYNCNTTSSTTNVAVCTSQLPYSWNGNNYNAAGTYTKALINSTGCDSIASLVLSVSAGKILGPLRACAYTQTAGGIANYSVAAPTGSTYLWTVSKPTQMLIVSGQGTNNINVQYTDDFVSGTIYVKVTNAACNFTIKPSIGISKANPSTPGAIKQFAPVACSFVGNDNEIRYTINKVPNATSYNWSAQAGTTTITHTNGAGANDTTVTVKFSGAFSTSNISVQAVNDCGASSTRVLSISTKPATPNVINLMWDNSTACPRTQTYSLSPQVVPSNSTYVQWTVPAGGTIVSGQGSPAIFVSYNSNAISGYVTAQGGNNCGLGTARKLHISLPVGTCAPRSTLARENTVMQPNINDFNINVYPNPAVNDFKLQVNTSAKEKISIRLFDMTGRFLLQTSVNANQLTSFGANLKPGVYVVEVTQGNNIKSQRLIKL